MHVPYVLQQFEHEKYTPLGCIPSGSYCACAGHDNYRNRPGALMVCFKTVHVWYGNFCCRCILCIGSNMVTFKREHGFKIVKNISSRRVYLFWSYFFCCLHRAILHVNDSLVFQLCFFGFVNFKFLIWNFLLCKRVGRHYHQTENLCVAKIYSKHVLTCNMPAGMPQWTLNRPSAMFC